MQSLITISDFVNWRREAPGRIAFVPTMGALHEGHISLVNLAQKKAEQAVVSIFVNPTQFGPNEDFSKYPRTLSDDLEMLSQNGVAAVFLPNVNEIYPSGFQTFVSNRKFGNVLCGASRPGHFDGVLTVVLRLLQIVSPQIAVFGKKDFQQLFLIKQMIEDFSLGIDIVGGDLIRANNGLALSSRNRYLNSDQVATATLISKVLFAALDKCKNGVNEVEILNREARESFMKESNIELEYLEFRNIKTFEPVEGKITQPTIMLFAGRVGNTRLIDNIEME